MQTQIVKMINDFEHGRLSRRQLIAYLTGMFAASLGAAIAFADQQAGRTAPQPMRSRDSKPPASRPDAKRGVCILPIRTASNVRSRVRDTWNSHGRFELDTKGGGQIVFPEES